MLNVVAALIWRDGKLLICKRPENKARGLLWEFVGGKVENGETEQEALIRECKEELDVIIAVDELFARVFHHYDDVDVRLSVYNARIIAGEIKMLEHCDIQWISADRLREYEFCPADKDILEKLEREYSCKE